jgi:hypothetical protein
MEIEVEEIYLSLLPELEFDSAVPRILFCLCNPVPSKGRPPRKQGKKLLDWGGCRPGERR